MISGQGSEGVKSGMRGSRNSLQELRPLNSCPEPLTYKVQHDDILEFEAKYLGDIPSFPQETDITNRTDVLGIVDKGKKHMAVVHPVIFTLSKSGVKVSRRDRQETELLTVGINEIASMCYIKEDGIHILALKHGTQESCSLAVLHCETQETAEGICALVDQCFNLVYTDVMIEMIEETIDIVIGGGSISFTGSSDSTPINDEPPYFSFEDVDVPEDITGSVAGSATNLYGGNYRPPQQAHSTISHNSRNSTESSQAELLRDFMSQLRRKLKPDELVSFKTFLDRYYSRALPILDFCKELLALYGPSRKNILAGMYPFINETDCKEFEKFLKVNDVSLVENGQTTINNHHSLTQLYSRSLSDVSMTGNVGNDDLNLTTRASDMDSMLDEMSRRMEHIGASVGDPTNTYLQYDRNNKL